MATAAPIALAKLIAPNAAAVARAVELACTDPASYVKQHAAALRERGITKPSAGLPWIALVDALLAAKHLVNIDWKCTAEDLTWSLGRLATLPKRRSRWRWLEA